MKTKLLFSLLILSLFVNVVVISTFGFHYYRNFCMPPALLCHLNEENHHLYQSLGLTEAQLAKMVPLSKLFHTRLAALESQVIAKRDLMIRLLAKEEIDLVPIEEARTAVTAIQDEIQREVVVHITQTRDILNPEQRKHFFKMLQDSAADAQLNSAFPITGGNK
jgi:Spy/CpxP family protein refolding chaperone